MSTVTMQELELETAELLPDRETLGVHSGGHSGSSFSVTQVVAGNGSHDGNGNGNAGGWLSPSILSGNGNGNLDGNTIAIQVLK
jgi:hypothetical protein